MKTFTIPVSYEMYGFIKVEAETLDEALEIAETDETLDLPDSAEYVQDSWQVDREAADMYNQKKGDYLWNLRLLI